MQINKSSELLRKTRETQARRIIRLSHVYTEVLEVLLGQDMPGQIELDGWGVRPKPGVDLKSNGQAMATLANVIGFDLACLASTLLGLTELPRFFIHDSLNASDLERAIIYDRIFLLLLQHDPPKGRRLPNIQYVITTTTVPPPAANPTYASRLAPDHWTDTC